MGPGQRSGYSELLRAGGLGVQSPVGDEIFRTGPHRPQGPRSKWYNGYRCAFQGKKRPGRGVHHSLACSTEVTSVDTLQMQY